MHDSESSAKLKNSRILTLDYLRGFFLIVIIIDHLWRWPSIFQYISGRGELWASAAEGFVIISGLLVGYIRGSRSIDKPISGIIKKVWTRAGILYLWALLTTIAFVVLSWWLDFDAPIAYVPFNDWEWGTMLGSVFSLSYVHSLTHFLYLYAIFLFASPLAILALRNRKPLIVVSTSIILFILGRLTGIEWLQWQILFFLPAVFGHYLEPIQGFLSRMRPVVRRNIYGMILLASGVTIVLSAMIILPSVPGTYHVTSFSREPLSIERVLIAFLWVSALAIVCTAALPWLQRRADWLLRVLGTRSLSAYIIHGIPIMFIALLVPLQNNFWVNTLTTLAAILATWGLLKIPIVARLIPR